ncbi:phosphoglycerate mutase-like protein [Sistotremastrum suecicum HHB10207 ss-3]|uniref:Phosphoglycerate mutase-like protein n=1 Tax=Sistotremastrum suecicum HHB10207 ss-3 TaxID=1314776 RepID=A0A166EYD8_9AGAM|nr:phosphoglycerate mutase-like protein [Sistotremastrum suecicum HHB10207 ss-3]
MLALLAFLGLPLVEAAKFSASSFAGATTAAVWPPPNATHDASLFPPSVGFPGPTPSKFFLIISGAEPEAIATAPAAAQVSAYFPLLNPGTKDSKTFNTPRLWGNLAPWFSVASQGLPQASPQIPKGCELNQVHLLHRHGARYPTTGSSPSVLATALHNATVAGTGFTATGELAFLNDWSFKLGAELLTPFGREQLFDLGVGFRVKYGDLLNNFTTLPVFRTTSEQRMLDSALNFAAGFFGVPNFLTDYNQEIIIEADGFNNTLAPYETCQNSNLPVGNFGNVQIAKWQNIYLAAAQKRLQKEIKGINLTIPLVFAMQQTCAYETVALGFSSFCDLFTEEEWKGYEYSNDITFWYSNSFGNPTSAAMGIGWVSELVSRLTKTPISVHNTTTNGTLDNSLTTFPLNQTIYVDASHDTIISAIIVALNFTTLAKAGPLPTNEIQKNQACFYRSFIVSEISPFASNLVGQVLSCPASSEPTHIRWILNDAVVPLTGVKGCTADKNGLCKLSTFISAMKERVDEIDWAFDCLANYTVADPASIVDGRPPVGVRPKDEIPTRRRKLRRTRLG